MAMFNNQMVMGIQHTPIYCGSICSPLLGTVFFNTMGCWGTYNLYIA